MIMWIGLWIVPLKLDIKLFVNFAALKDRDGNPYSVLDNTETGQTVDSNLNTNRHLLSRRTDEDTTAIDAMSKSDKASLCENCLGKSRITMSSQWWRDLRTAINGI